MFLLIIIQLSNQTKQATKQQQHKNEPKKKQKNIKRKQNFVACFFVFVSHGFSTSNVQIYLFENKI